MLVPLYPHIPKHEQACNETWGHYRRARSYNTGKYHHYQLPNFRICKYRFDNNSLKEAGADGIFISNHDALILDYLSHPFQVMDEIACVARGKAAILVDGGFRRGSDAFKGFAFEAQLVSLGRPIFNGLAANGAVRVKDVIQQITEELVRFMSMTGSTDPEHVKRDLLIKN
jgi:isopentenyl diphosphate isomerase/L-lactate dehydrogenase-like FMN-dependent dehydrogenase